MGKKAAPICVQQRNLLHQNQINNNYVPVLSKYKGFIINNNLYKIIKTYLDKNFKAK